MAKQHRRRRFLRDSLLALGAVSTNWTDFVSDGLHDILSDISGYDSNVPIEGDEDFWHLVKQAYTVSPAILNLNNGGVCPQPRVVQEAVERYNRLSNEAPSYYMWRVLDRGREPIRDKLADIAGHIIIINS